MSDKHYLSPLASAALEDVVREMFSAPPVTHYAGCWRDPRHHACAVARIDALEAALRDCLDAWALYGNDSYYRGESGRIINRARALLSEKP